MPVVSNVVAPKQVPDWLCEIASSSTGHVDRTRKLPIYSRERVAHLWLIDPAPRTFEVYRLETPRWLLVATYGGSTIVRAEPFGDLEMYLRRLWGEA